jgi:hypothetical protein
MFEESARLVVWLVPIILFAVIILPRMIRILREYQRGVIFRLGKLLGTKGPGLISSFRLASPGNFSPLTIGSRPLKERLGGPFDHANCRGGAPAASRARNDRRESKYRRNTVSDLDSGACTP